MAGEYFSPFDEDPNASSLASATAPVASPRIPLVVPEAAGLAEATAPTPAAVGPMASMPEAVGGSAPAPNFQTASGQSVFAPAPVVTPPVGVAGGTTTPTARPQAATQAATKPATGGGGGDPRMKELKDLGAKIRGSQEATVGTYEGLAKGDKERAQELDDIRRGIATERMVQNSVDQYHSNQLVLHDQEATKRTGDELAAIKDASAKVAGMKVDEDRYRKKLGVGGAMAGILGAMVSGFQGGFSGRGGNDFLDRYEREVDKDIALQEKAIANARTDVQQRINNFGMLKAQLGDERQAKLGAKIMAFDDAQKRIAAAKEKMEGVEAKGAADKAIADLELRKEQTVQQYAGGRKNEIVGQLSAEAAGRAAADKARKDEEWKNKDYELRKLEAEGKAATAQASRDATFVKPLGVYVGSAAQADKLMPILDATDRMIGSGEKLLKGFEAGKRWGEDAGELKALANDVALASGLKDNLGALSESDLKMMPADSTQVENWIRSGQIGQLRTAIEIAKRAKSRIRANYGVRDLDNNDLRRERVDRDAAGKQTPGAEPEGAQAVGNVSGG